MIITSKDLLPNMLLYKVVDFVMKKFKLKVRRFGLSYFHFTILIEFYMIHLYH